MAELKTRPTDADVDAFLDSVDNDRRRQDARTVCAMMQKITRREPVLWGSSIVGFGTYSYEYANGKRGDWPLTGLSPRKQALTVYVMSGFDEHDELRDAPPEVRVAVMRRRKAATADDRDVGLGVSNDLRALEDPSVL